MRKWHEGPPVHLNEGVKALAVWTRGVMGGGKKQPVVAKKKSLNTTFLEKPDVVVGNHINT